MSSKTRKIVNQINKEKKENIAKNQMIAIQQMKQLFDSPLKIRLKFCLKLLFRK